MTTNTLPAPPFEGVVRLADLGLIRAQGADAATFLHGQLTNDIAHLERGHARLAGYCTAKGRLLASFVVWRNGDELLLACSADLLAATLKRLRMFVLRAKCTLSDASAELPLYGLAGPAAATWLGASVPEVWCTRDLDGATVIRLPDGAGTQRFLLAGPSAAPTLPPLDEDAWRRLEVRSGIARVELATVEQFVPQMLNFELVGGVDFGKGCYPGQEIVARSQYRGTIKRRSVLFEMPAPAARAGAEVFHSDDPDQPAGQVVNAAAGPAGGAQSGSVALVEVKLAALVSGSLHLGAPGGALLTRVAMPYDVPMELTTPA